MKLLCSSSYIFFAHICTCFFVNMYHTVTVRQYIICILYMKKTMYFVFSVMFIKTVLKHT